MTGLYGTTQGPWIVDGRMIGPSCVVPVAITCHFDIFGGIHDAPNYKSNGRAIALVPEMLALVKAVANNGGNTNLITVAALGRMAQNIATKLEEKP